MTSLRAEKARQQEAARRSKLSGRELFQKDTTLVDSDLKFLEDGENRGAGWAGRRLVPCCSPGRAGFYARNGLISVEWRGNKAPLLFLVLPRHHVGSGRLFLLVWF